MTDLPPELRELVARLREPVPPSAAFRDRVLARVARPRPGRLAWIAGAVLAAAALAGLLLRPAADAARPVQFVLLAPHAARVTIVGDFNDWNLTATPLQSAGDSAWFVVVPLRPGRYRYSFVLDGQRWMADPTAPRAADSDFGPQSSVVTILNHRT